MASPIRVAIEQCGIVGVKSTLTYMKRDIFGCITQLQVTSIKIEFSSTFCTSHDSKLKIDLVLGVVDVHLVELDHVQLFKSQGVLGVVDVPITRQR